MGDALASSSFGLDLHGEKDKRRERGLLLDWLTTLALAVSSSADGTEGAEVLGKAREALLLAVVEVCDWKRDLLRASSSSRSLALEFLLGEE